MHVGFAKLAQATCSGSGPPPSPACEEGEPMLRDLRVRSKLVAILVVPLVALGILGTASGREDDA